MKFYETIAELAHPAGIHLENPTDTDSGGAEVESDWGLMRGPDRPSEAEGGWMLTFARTQRGDTTGALVAYEQDESGSQTGRCALLRAPWDEHTDRRELDRAVSSDLWVQASLADIDAFVQRA